MPKVIVDYSKAPENWFLAEFMATLPNAGVLAREYLKERGYVNPVNRSELPEKSTLESNGLNFIYGALVRQPSRF